MQPEGKNSGRETAGQAAAGQRGSASLPAINLPKGGGAIRGQGEKFGSNPATGSGSMSVPLATSPGRSGFGPELSLSYDSGSGNGPFGFGWTLSLPAITRKTDRGLPRYRDEDESDTFILAGSEDLVPVLDAAGGRVSTPRTVRGVAYRVRPYRPRVEGLFARVERWTRDDDGVSHWRLITTDNVTTLFGFDENSRVRDPRDPRRVYSYLIHLTFDDRGHAAHYVYAPEDSRGVATASACEANRSGAARAAQRYPKWVRYGNVAPYFRDWGAAGPAQAPPADWHFQMVFDYGDHRAESPAPAPDRDWPVRPDPFSSYRAGFEVRTYRRCERVLLFHRFAGQAGFEQPALVRSTDLLYSDEVAPADERNPVYTFLASVTQTGYRRRGAEVVRRSTPPLEFFYSQPEVSAEVLTLEDAESRAGLPEGLDGARFRWLDLDGEGLPGILSEHDGGWGYKRNLSPVNEVTLAGGERAARARFGPLEQVPALPAPASLRGGQQLLDLEGGGRLQLVSFEAPAPGYFARAAGEGWEPFRPFTSLPQLDWSEPNLKFVDLTGDGRADLLITEEGVHTFYPSLGAEGFGAAERVPVPWDEERGPRVVFADGTQSVTLADMTGDGLSDIVRVRAGEVCYWPNLGHGRFGAKVSMDDAPRFAGGEGFEPRRLRFADLDGSGTTDLLYVGEDGVMVCFNRSGNSWAAPRRLAVFPGADALSDVQVTDLLGNGTACLVWSSPLPGESHAALRYVDLMGSRKPHLMVGTRNNLGAETRVRFAPSTRFYLADKLAGRPWVTKLPHVVHVVERVETFDRVGRSRFVTRYRYHHGYFDPDEREFRGFGMVEQWDTEEHRAETAFPEGEDLNWDAASWVPPVLTRTWFHNGAFVEGEAVSRQYEREYWVEPALRPADRAADRAALLLPDTVLPPGLGADEAREAVRALKGQALRVEVYAEDGSPRAALPYTVTEQNFTVRRVQQKGVNRHAVFHTHQREAVSFHYERDPGDPRVTHDVTLRVDAFGNELSKVTVGYPRRPGHPAPEPELSAAYRAMLAHDQSRLRVSATGRTMTGPVADPAAFPDAHRAPQPAEAVVAEWYGVAPLANRPGITNLFNFAELESHWDALWGGAQDTPYEEIPSADVDGSGALPSTPRRRVVDRTRTLYRRDDLSALLALEELEPRALHGESYQLALTPAHVARLFDGLVPDVALTEGGYVQLAGVEGWWMPSGRVFYSPDDAAAPAELAEARAHFFLPRRAVDAFGARTRVSYDAYDLLPATLTDAVGNATAAVNDYRVLQPSRVTDANGNRVEAAFDALGQVVGNAVMGKAAEGLGDTLAGFEPDLDEATLVAHFDDPLADPASILAGASARTLYDLFAYLRTRGALAPDPAAYGGDIKAWVRDDANFERAMGIITLADPSAEPDPCSFDALEFRFARPMDGVGDTSTRIGAVEFARLLRFIRLWRKLGWTVEQTDAAVCALFPVPPFPAAAAAVDTLAELDAGFRRLLPRLGIVLRVMRELNLNAKRDLLPLLALWSPLGTYGQSSLYRQMFLSPAMLEQDAAFADNGYGEYLRDDTQKLVGHAEALRAAFGLTGEEFAHILAALGFDADTSSVAYTHPQPTLGAAVLETAPGLAYDGAANRLSFKGALTAATRDALKALPGVGAQFQAAVDALYAANQAALTGLTLDNLSAVFRRGWLARKLKLSVRELLLLTSLTGLDPFAAPDPTDPAVLRLVELVAALKGRSLKSSAALYLMWDQDLSGKSAPDPAQVLEFARTLRGDFAGIEDQFAAVEDPGGDLARARMALVYGSETADAFFALLDETILLDVPYTHAQPALEAAVTAADARLGYDDFRHRLTRTGPLDAATRDALTGLAGVSADFQAAVAALFALGEDARGSFFTRHPELEPLYAAYVTSAAPPEERRAALLAAFRPELARRRKRQQALQRLSAAANTTPDFTRAVLDPPAAPFPLHAEGQPARPALDDIVALDRAGLAAQFFFRDTATGAVDLNVAAAASLDYAPGGDNPLPANAATPGAAVSAVWSGLVETPEAGFYNFVVEADAGATVTLSLGGQPRALTRNGKVWRNTQPLELAAGALHELVVTVNRVRDAAAVKWETPKRPREVIPARHLYPAALFPPFIAAYVRFLKAASLAQGLRLTPAEFAHLAAHADYQIAGDNWPNLLPATGPPAPAVAAALLAPLAALLDFARIKSELAPDDESLLNVLRAPAAAAADADGLLFKLTRWDRKSFDDLLAHFGLGVAALSGLAEFRRVYDAFALATLMGVPASALIQATTNEPAAGTVRALQAALRARYEPEDWRTVVQPVNDEMRALQRDALVAYILHQMRSRPDTAHVDTADKLFEYFLMDVQMEPCMQTSRIRHALSSVQLFIERCLMNLERFVSPAALDAKQWEWMKRYRIWEANRKVFLFPENWLEPELRDNKSPFFKEVESELLQSDITDDTAAAALLNYLARLEEIAKLEPCGIYHVEADPARQRSAIDHVVARTTGAGRKYYYRRREGVGWTPWEQIKLDIEDNPVVPVVWKGRLLLFWARLQKESQIDPTKLKTSQNGGNLAAASMASVQADAKQNSQDNARVTVKAVLCWSEYYNGKWQAAKTSDVDRPTEVTWFTSPEDFDRSRLLLTTHEEGAKHHLRVSFDFEGYSTFILYNTHGQPRREEDDPHVVADMFIGPRYLDSHLAAFRIEYYIFEDSALGEAGTTHKRTLLTNPLADRTVETQHPVKNIWAAPFFYADPLHVFHVRTAHEAVPYGRHPGYGVDYTPGVVHEIPPLVFERDPRLPRRPWEDDPLGPDDYRVVNPADVVRFVTEDADIRRGIAATGSVNFNGRRIGARGALSGQGVRM